MTDVRDQFCIPDEQIYLLAHSIGLTPKSASQYVQENVFEVWQSDPAKAWPKWLGVIDEFKQALADLFNTDATCFCPQSNISSGLTKVLQSFPGPVNPQRNVILLTENDFPSVGFVLKKAEALGFVTRMIPKSEDPQNIETWEAALTEDVFCTLATHAHYKTSQLVPVTEITKLTRERGIISMVDLAQSSGVVPIDFSQWQADIVVGSCVKWLCGGPGAGFLWIDANLIEQLKPIDVGWFSHQNPFEFDIHNFDYAQGSSRFWGGTPTVTPFALAANSIRQLTNIGIDNIRAHNSKLTNRLIDAVKPENVVSPIDPSLRGGTLVVKFLEQSQAEQTLIEAGVKFDSRASGIRMSPHIYTTEEEIEQVARLLANH